MLQDLSLYYKDGLISSDEATIDSAILPPQTGSLLAINSYAPGSQTSLAMTGGATANSASLAAFDSTNINTGDFTAPASGNVLVQVTASFKASAAANVNVVGLCAHGTVTPVIGVTSSFQCGATNDTNAYTFRFYVTGLTAGNTYNFDLAGSECAASTASFTLVAFGQSATTPSGSAGGPVVLTVQAV